MKMLLLKMILLSSYVLPINLDKPLSDSSKIKFNKYQLSPDLKLAPNLYTTQTGFFCNQERALEKKTKMAIKFRLGSLEQTQKLEGYALVRSNN